MAACSSCKQALPPGSLSCPNCGRRCLPDGHPPLASSVPPPDDDLELDLSLAPPVRGGPLPTRHRAGFVPDLAPSVRPEAPGWAPGKVASARPLAPAGQAPPPGERFDQGDDEQGPAIALEVDAAPLAPRARTGGSSIPPDGSSRPAPPLEERASAAPAAARRPPPSEPVFVDPVVVQALGDYGPVPVSPWESPTYALRVLARRRALGAALPAAERAVDDAERAVEKAMVAMMDASRAPLEQSASSEALLSPSREIEDLARQRRRALDDYEQEHRERRGALDLELGALEQRAPAEQAALDEARLSVASAFDRLKQAGPSAPRERLARAALDEAKRLLASLEETTAAAGARRGEIRRARRQLEEAHPARLSALQDAHALTESERQKAALSLAGQLRTSKGGEMDPAARARLALAEDARKAARVRLEAHRRAMGAFDRRKVRQAALLVGGAALALLLFIGVGVYRMF